MPTLPVTDPVHRGLSEGQLLGYMADYLQDAAARAAGLIRPATLHATYGDDFADAALDAKWTRVGLVAGDHSYQTRGGSWMDVDCGTANSISRLIHQPWTSVSDATVCARIASVQLGGGHPNWGVCFTDNAGNGIGVTWHSNSANFCLIALSAWGWSSYPVLAPFPTTVHSQNVITGAGGLWLKLRKSGTNYYAAYSLDGLSWSPETVAAVNATAMTRCGIGMFWRFAGSAATTAHKLSFDFFNCDA